MTDQAGITKKSESLALQNGKSFQSIKTSQPNIIIAHAGEHYRIVKLKAGQRQLLDNVIVKKSDDDLQLSYADGTQIVIKNFYIECKTGCDLILPGQGAADYTISGKNASGSALNDGTTLIYAHGSHDAMTAMAQGELTQILSGMNGAELTYIPSIVKVDSGGGSFGMLGLAAGGLGLAAAAAGGGGGGGGGGGITAIVHMTGKVLAGPVTAANGATVYLYQADGTTLLGSSALSNSGNYNIDITGYTGPVKAVLGSGISYMDEATGQTHVLTTPLMAVGVASTTTVSLNINMLTTLAAMKLGSAVLTSDTVTQTNAAVASAFGLSGINLVGTDITPTINAVGAVNQSYTPYGAILSVLSGMDSINQGQTQVTLQSLKDGLNINGSTGTLLNGVLDTLGLSALKLAGTGVTNLTGVLLNLLAKSDASVSINSISSDNLLNAADSSTLITGVTTGNAVSLSIGGNTRIANVSGNSWSYTLNSADWTAISKDLNATGQAGETITATSSTGGVATRSFVVDTLAPSVNSVAITSVSGAQHSTLNAGDALSITVNMSEPTYVAGTPQLVLNIGGTLVQANYASGSGTSTLLFNYTILANQNDSNGISIPASSITLNGGSLRDIAGNNATTLTFAAVTDNPGVLVDTSAPILVSSNPAINEALVNVSGNIVLTFSEPVTAGSGNIVLSNGDGDSRTISINDVSQVTISGDTVTINPNHDLFAGMVYHVQIASGLLLDTAGNASNASTLNFSTAATIDLSAIAAGTGGFVINGSAGERSGAIVASAGDVNGDGLSDVIIGTTVDGTTLGHSYVVFGKTDTATVNLTDIANGIGGFVLNGQNTGDWSGCSVAGIGDVNGDGLSDLIVGAKHANPSGSSYVVFGKTDTTAIELSDITAGVGGFVINGENAGDLSGSSVSGAGDVNGDGLADLIVGSPGNAGASYVVFGKSDTTSTELSDIAAGVGGFVIKGQSAGDHLSVSGAGDVNGDGLADLIVGSPGGASSFGNSYVVFGKNDNTDAVDLSKLGNGGFVINGQSAGDQSGFSVASAGDVNGDGLSDLLVGAYWSNPAADIDAGRSYVVFGKTDTAAVDLSAIANGIGGFVINGQNGGDLSGISVASAGDLNGDGLTDLIIGAKYGSPATGSHAGISYVVFGKTDTAAVDLSAIAEGRGGFVINGENANDVSGISVASAGDINGDGLNDLIVGAAQNSSIGTGLDAGLSYVIFGSATGVYTQTAVNHWGSSYTGSSKSESLVGSASDDTLIGNGGADVLYGGAGNDLLVLNASNIAALSSGVDSSGHLARVDGGSGLDTLKLVGANIMLDLTSIANQGGDASRITSIEHIDLGTGNNTLKLSLSDVLDMSGMNLFNNVNNWVNGTYNLSNHEEYHQLVIDGSAGDSVNSSGWGTSLGNVTNSGHIYDVYTQDLAQLLIDHNINQQVL